MHLQTDTADSAGRFAARRRLSGTRMERCRRVERRWSFQVEEQRRNRAGTASRRATGRRPDGARHFSFARSPQDGHQLAPEQRGPGSDWRRTGPLVTPGVQSLNSSEPCVVLAFVNEQKRGRLLAVGGQANDADSEPRQILEIDRTGGERRDRRSPRAALSPTLARACPSCSGATFSRAWGRISDLWAAEWLIRGACQALARHLIGTHGGRRGHRGRPEPALLPRIGRAPKEQAPLAGPGGHEAGVTDTRVTRCSVRSRAALRTGFAGAVANRESERLDCGTD